VFSAAERSVDGKRIRHFTADDLFALACAFDLPITYFLRPPTPVGEISHAESTATVSRLDYLDQVFDVGEDASDWLLTETVEMTAETTPRVRRWGANFAAMVTYRERAVAALIEGARRAGVLPENEEEE
jgi:hypothetical protein